MTGPKQRMTELAKESGREGLAMRCPTRNASCGTGRMNYL
jgi:hypothetical protein